jgi:hypothetical protein
METRGKAKLSVSTALMVSDYGGLSEFVVGVLLSISSTI